jgi:RHS repeat-associated protein
MDNGSTAKYVYNETGSRVQKNIGSGFTEYYYGPNGSVQDEYNGSAWTAQYVYAERELIAEYKNNTTEFVHTDHLGSTRLVTAVNKSVLDSLDYLPFGKQVAGDTSTTHKFTGKERDAESGLDDFGGRYYNSTTGRFITPDWSDDGDPIPYAELESPQSLNLYSYVENNPLNVADEDGHDPAPAVSCGFFQFCWLTNWVKKQQVGGGGGPGGLDPIAAGVLNNLTSMNNLGNRIACAMSSNCKSPQ